MKEGANYLLSDYIFLKKVYIKNIMTIQEDINENYKNRKRL